MEERRGKVRLMTFIRPHRSGFALSVVLAIISVASGLVPVFCSGRDCESAHQW